MLIDVWLVIFSVFQGEKRYYLNGAVVGETGGQLKISVEGQKPADLVGATKVHLKGLCVPNIGKDGLYLKFLGSLAQ